MSSAIGRAAIPGACAAILIALPFALSDYHIFQLTMVVIYSIALLGLNLLIGFNGQISLGHGAFFAIGAYTAAILLQRTDIPYWATVPLCGAICLGAGFLFGLPALRLEGLYLALPTFALAVATPQLLTWQVLAHWTGGVQGISFAKPDPPDFLPLDADQWLYFFLCHLRRAALPCRHQSAARRHRPRPRRDPRSSRWPLRRWASIPPFYKTATFGVSAMFTGVAGALQRDRRAICLTRQFSGFSSASAFWSASSSAASPRSRGRLRRCVHRFCPERRGIDLGRGAACHLRHCVDRADVPDAERCRRHAAVGGLVAAFPTHGPEIEDAQTGAATNQPSGDGHNDRQQGVRG